MSLRYLPKLLLKTKGLATIPNPSKTARSKAKSLFLKILAENRVGRVSSDPVRARHHQQQRAREIMKR
jgi:hypothetical protein